MREVISLSPCKQASGKKAPVQQLKLESCEAACVFFVDLMKLKRSAPKQQGSSNKAKKSDAFISRFAGGLSFDFSSKDSNM